MKKIIFLLLPLLLLTAAAFRVNSNITVTGTVTDEKGMPVEGATISVQGTHIATATDLNGSFRLSNVAENAMLVVTSVGFVPRSEKVNGRTVIQITVARMQPSQAELTTVTVGAFGMRTTKRSKGTVSSSPSILAASGTRPRNVTQALSGKISGLSITNSSAPVSGEPRLVLRGLRSVSGNNKPLYIVDGVQVSEAALRGLTPNDINKIDILKGAQSATLYGSEGINGTVIITTTGNFVPQRDSVAMPQPPAFIPEGNTEDYDRITENIFLRTTDEPLSTFSIDVDAAAYSNVRRFLNSGTLPPSGAVRTEEMINYFKYKYPQPSGNDPFSINTEIANCPWNSSNKLVLIGLQGKEIPVQNLPASNLVFLIDVSGSMQDENKLPLVQQSLKMLTDKLREEDKISIVVYAGNAGLVLPATGGADKSKIKAAIDALRSGGSTAGGAGIQLAYKIAQQNKIIGGNNRIILCTDGDFNVGESSDDALVRLVEKERAGGVYLTVLGYGMGNYKDNKMQQLADKGNGNHAYIDGLAEAKKVLVSEFGGTLFTIAKDVKLQLEFNPAKVKGYRLIGYENRLLANEDFNDDKKDAGELGSGHSVTALYEIIPAGVESNFLKNVDSLKYTVGAGRNVDATLNDELLTIKFRYKSPEKNSSELIEHVVKDAPREFAETTDNFRFAAAVANFSMMLHQSLYNQGSSFTQVINIANNALGDDKEGYRKEFVSLVKKAQEITGSKAAK